jgi:hypothetical protein
MAKEAEEKQLEIPCECEHSFAAHQIVEGRCWVYLGGFGKHKKYCCCTGGYHQMDNLDYLVWKKQKGA